VVERPVEWFVEMGWVGPPAQAEPGSDSGSSLGLRGAELILIRAEAELKVCNVEACWKLDLADRG